MLAGTSYNKEAPAAVGIATATVAGVAALATEDAE